LVVQKKLIEGVEVEYVYRLTSATTIEVELGGKKAWQYCIIP